jgi:putative aminopeptidase FrvX
MASKKVFTEKSFIKKALLFLVLFSLSNQSFSQKKPLVHNLLEFSKTSAITGREIQASNFIESLLPDLRLNKDRLGNLTLEFGTGSPRKLFAVPLDEPGYVISKIQEDGYLKITKIGRGHNGALYHQFLQGHEVVINTANGSRIGVATVPSSHFDGLRVTRESAKAPFNWQEAFIDVGASSAAEVAEMGISLLDPLSLNKKPSIIDDQFLATSSANTKAAAIALAAVANSIDKKTLKGTVVLAWTSLELINGKGLESVKNAYGQFDEIHIYKRQEASGDNEYHIASAYTDSPVEMVRILDIENLISNWLSKINPISSIKHLPIRNHKVNASNYSSFTEEHQIVSDLISKYGVSGSEDEVRDYILSEMPQWAKPTVDEKGNIILSFGQGEEHKAFVAHMDETGAEVESIRDDGRLTFRGRGGMFPWLLEAQPALLHTKQGKISAVFEPRFNYQSASKRNPKDRFLIYAGFDSKEEALAVGIIEGNTKVTMPKAMIRLSETKAAARGFDDRVGCAALLLSLNNIDPSKLKQRITFVWSVEEEVGLVGAAFAAQNLKDISIVHPIDTYVSSDDPYTNETFANCPLGQGAVIRVLESINFISRENLKSMQELANKNNINTQYGMTAGGTDGQPFLAYGIPSVPLSWPGRYSHSPIEIMDYRDMQSLIKLISAIINE